MAARTEISPGDWWRTSIIDIEPGKINVRGYPVQDLIGRVDFVSMIWLYLTGELLHDSRRKLLEGALVGSMDHGPHAPSIATARMAVSCGLPLNSAVATGAGMLGDIHGGAGQQCMAFLYKLSEMVEARKAEGGADPVKAAVAEYMETESKFIPGFGHRFHPVDPRVPRLYELLDEAKRDGAITGQFADLAAQVEDVLAEIKGKRLPMNIDGVSAAVFCEFGLAPELGRGLFVLARSVGVLAHAYEQGGQGQRIKGPIPRHIPYTYDGPAERRHPDAVASGSNSTAGSTSKK
jgi:citrate synthase